MDFQAVDEDFSDVAVDNIPVIGEDTTNKGNTQEDNSDIYIPEELKTGKKPVEQTPQQKPDNSDFVKALKETFKWEDVPDDANPVDTLKLVVEMYENQIKEMQQEGETKVQSTKYNEAISEYTASYEAFKKLDAKDAVKQYLMNTEDLTEEEANEEVADLELEGKLDKQYRKISRKIDKEYQEGVEALKIEITKREQLARQQAELEEKQFVANMKNEINSFKSDYFEVTAKDREMVEYALLQPQDNGSTLIQNMLSDPKTLIEMVLAYTNLPNFASQPQRLKKQIASDLVNRMSDEPIFNPKQNRDYTIDDYWKDAQDEVESFS